MKDGFLKISRSFFSTAMWNDAREFSECEAWIDLLRSARFEATGKAYSELIGGREVSYSRGQYPASISFLSRKWRWSEKKVRCFLAKLKKEKMITVCGKQGMNVITICDYDCYDGNDEEDCTGSCTENETKGKAKGKGSILEHSELHRLRARLRARLMEISEEIDKKLDELENAKGKAKGIDTELEDSELQSQRAGQRASDQQDKGKAKGKGPILEHSELQGSGASPGASTEDLGQGKGRKKKNINNIYNIPPTPPKGEGLNSKARSLFEDHYKSVFGEGYYWSAKDAGAMSQLLRKLEFQRTQKGMDNTEESVLYALRYLLSSIREGWIFENFSVTNINSKFNEIVAKAKKGTQVGYDTGVILRNDSPEKYNEGW